MGRGFRLMSRRYARSAVSDMKVEGLFPPTIITVNAMNSRRVNRIRTLERFYPAASMGRGFAWSREQRNTKGVYPTAINYDKAMKSGRPERAWFGGGDPDRTGDPRLMSPLLCQLSYTATEEVACGKPILPEEGPDCLRSGGWKLTIHAFGR